MRKTIATVCLSGTLDEKLQAAASAGFDGVELFENDFIAAPLTPAEVRERAADLGLEIALYQPFRDFEAVGPEQLERNLRRAEAKLDLMEALGAPTLLVCSNVQPDAIDDDALAAAQLRLLGDRAERRGLRIAYEALAWGRHVADVGHSWRIARAADHPAVGVCVDSFHVLSRGTDPAAIREIPGERIFFLQLADAPHLAMDVIQWSRHHRCFPGQGAFDLAAFCAHVLATGYAGPLSLEVFNDVFRQADPRRTARDAMRSLRVLEDELGVRALPAPARLDATAFVELAVDGDGEAEAEELLRALGFAHVGPHRTKPVQLWERGAARVLLNRGDTHSGVVAVGLHSAAPGRSAARAQALLAPVLDRRTGPGEAELAAIAAPDDTTLLFCGDGWRDDFVTLADADRPEPGPDPALTAIDHLALAQPFDAFPEAVLFHRSVLDLHPLAGQDIAAPDGLLRSRALASADGAVRLVLNVPALGSGHTAEQQHVAFACADVLAAARALRDRGAPLLHIPGNYYDDLRARLDVDPELLEEMRELGVLYDRDAGGELRHLYTGRVGGRVFFELVERRGAYEGYGAANSPVRLAAQRVAMTPVS